MKNSEFLEFILIQTLWLCTLSLKSSDLGKEMIDPYKKLIKSLTESRLISENVVKDTLEEDALYELSYLNKNKYMTNRNKITTKMIYEIKKFNLLREENEGFSRVITELTQTNITDSNVSDIIENVFSMIGFYRIDPNRVTDIILDCYSLCPENRSFSKILHSLNKMKSENTEKQTTSAIPYIMKFKLKS